MAISANRATSRNIVGIRLRQLPSGAPWKRVALSPDRNRMSTTKPNTVATMRTGVASAGTCVPFTRRMSNAPSGGHHPSRRFVGGLVVAEVGDADIVDIVGAHGFHVCIGEQPAAVGAGENVAAEINALVSGVDDVALRVDQKRVLEPVPRDDLAEALAADHALPSRASSFLTAAFGSAKGAV